MEVTDISFQNFCGIMDKLLSDEGCPWDKKQTHESLRQYLLEETYEAIDAINKNDMTALCEELGDILLEVVFHSKIAEKLEQFTIDDVISGITKKMINRHRHIFGEEKADTAEEVLTNWDKIKDEEKGYRNVSERMRAVPNTLPSLIRAEKIQRRSGLNESITDKDANDIKSLIKNILNASLEHDSSPEKRDENAQEHSERERKMHFEKQIGILLFFVVRICRLVEVNPEFALTNALETYITRFENGDNPVNSGFAAII